MGSREARIALLFAVVGSGVAACGDDDPQEAAAASPTGNQPPVISGEPALAVYEGEAWEFAPEASDPDGDPLIFNVSGKPGWMEFDTQTGKLSGHPQGKDVGKHRGIVVSVSDGQDETTLDPMDVEVMPESAADNEPPTISGTPDSEAFVGSAYSFVPMVADAEGDLLSFQVVNRPDWAAFDATIGGLSGTPTSADIGVHADIVIRVSDGIAASELGPFVISVNAPTGGNSVPVISGAPDPDARVGEAWSFEPTALDADGDPLGFQVFNAPSWTSFDTATGRLSGTAGPGDDGTHGNITMVVSDGQASASLPAFAIAVVDPNTAPTISGNPDTSVQAGSAYAFTPDAEDADGDTLAFSIANRPSWASFDAGSGRLAGTPGASHEGAYTGIRITVSDGNDTATLGPFAITVSLDNRAPTISGSAPDAVLVGQSFAFTPDADDPDGDALGFSVANLPGWADFNEDNGRVSGTPGPGDVGLYTNVSITVSDGELSATLPAFSVEVLEIATGSATLSWAPPTENTDGSPLTDLAGFIVYWGMAPGDYSGSVTLDDPGVSTYIVGNLLSGSTYYFATSAFNADGLESAYSNVASKTIP